MSADEYVPDEMDARGCFLDGAAGAFTREDWEAFLARVRRDAAREALDDLALDFDDWGREMHTDEVARRIRHGRDTHYPKETP